MRVSRLGVVKILLVACSSLYISSAHAGWPSEGDWEYVEPMDVVGDTSLDRAVIFSFYNTTESQKDQVKGEIEELRNFAGLNYSSMLSLLNSLYDGHYKLRAFDLKYFKEYNTHGNWLDENRYYDDTSKDGVMMFSHRMNEPINGQVFALYDSFDMFKSILIKKQWLQCRDRYGDYCDNAVQPRLSASQAKVIYDNFISHYGVNIYQSNFVMYNHFNGDFYAVNYTNSRLDRATMYFLNLNSGAHLKPIHITEFEF